MSFVLQSLPKPSLELSDSLRSLLLSTTAAKFQTLCLNKYQFSGEVFEPLVHGIRSSANAPTIVFDECSFDSESTNLLEHAFQSSNSNGKMSTLEIIGHYPPSRFGLPVENVLTNILTSAACPFRTLRLEGSFCRCRKSEEINVIMQAVVLCPTLQCFKIDSSTLWIRAELLHLIFQRHVGLRSSTLACITIQEIICL